MELSSKSKTIKKRHRKKKVNIPESALLPIIKPGVSNCDSNWIKLQKIIGSEKGESSKPSCDKKMLKVNGSNNYPNNYKSFNHKASFSAKVSSESSLDKEVQAKVKSNKKLVVQNKGSKISHSITHSASTEHSKETVNETKTQNFEFNFNPSSDKSGKETNGNESSKTNEGRKLTKAVAMDCEMVGTGPKGDESIIARVSIVNSHGDCLYDEFVKPKEKVTDFRTQISGVRPSDLKNGKDLFEVQKDVLNIIEGRILVGHSIKHDLDVLFISHPGHLIRDTAFYKPFRELCGGRTPALKKLTSKILGCDIQSGEHSSVEDAQAAMLLYLRQRREWESLIKSQRKRKPKLIENQTRN